jgi:hypothetical protein
MALIGLASLAYDGISNWMRERRAIAEAPQRIAAAQAQQQANRERQQSSLRASVHVPQPGWTDYDEQERLLRNFSAALGERNDYAAMRALASLRSLSRTRQEQWRRQLGQLQANGYDLSGVPPATAVTDAGAAHVREGWEARDRGDRSGAVGRFSQGIWANADDADAWLGYGLSVANGQQAVGALTIALLGYPDAATARQRRDRYLALAAHDDVRRLGELKLLLGEAATAAEHQRQVLPAGMARLSEPVSWGTP